MVRCKRSRERNRITGGNILIIANFYDGKDPLESYHYNTPLSVYDYILYLIDYNMFVNRISKKLKKDYSRMNFNGVKFNV